MIDWHKFEIQLSASNLPAASAAERIRHLILLAIQAGDLPPGSRLKETELGAELHVSRTPLREALTALKAEQILETDDGGLRVRILDWQDISALYALRAKLEGMAALVAATHASTSEKQIIGQICADEVQLMAVGAAPSVLAVHNRRFHRAILQAAGNKFLSESLQQLSRLMVLLGTTAYSLAERTDSIQKEHQRINQAIQRGLPKEAEEAMQAHLDKALVARLTLLSLTDTEELD